MKHRIVAIALLGTAAASMACAQTAAPDQPTKPAAAMRHGDIDGDGVITRAEFLANAAKRFDAMDTDKDGKLTAEERRAAHAKLRAERPRGPGPIGDAGMGPGGPGGYKAGDPAMPPPNSLGGPRAGGPGGGGMLALLDANGDGKLSRAEFDAPFERLDANRDGVLDEAEIKAAPQGGGRLTRMAANNGGKVTRAQYDAPFARIDTNSDGVIDATEMQAVRARLGGGGRRFGGRGPRQSEAELQPQ